MSSMKDFQDSFTVLFLVLLGKIWGNTNMSDICLTYQTVSLFWPLYVPCWGTSRSDSTDIHGCVLIPRTLFLTSFSDISLTGVSLKL